MIRHTSNIEVGTGNVGVVLPSLCFGGPHPPHAEMPRDVGEAEGALVREVSEQDPHHLAAARIWQI